MSSAFSSFSLSFLTDLWWKLSVTAGNYTRISFAQQGEYPSQTCRSMKSLRELVPQFMYNDEIYSYYRVTHSGLQCYFYDNTSPLVILALKWWTFARQCRSQPFCVMKVLSDKVRSYTAVKNNTCGVHLITSWKNRNWNLVVSFFE